MLRLFWVERDDEKCRKKEDKVNLSNVNKEYASLCQYKNENFILFCPSTLVIPAFDLRGN